MRKLGERKNERLKQAKTLADIERVLNELLDQSTAVSSGLSLLNDSA